VTTVPKQNPCFCFTDFKATEKKRFKDIPDSFLEWFIGFVEGDGCFVMNSRGDLSFVITQSTTDIQVLLYIQKTLGFGSVIKQGETTSRFVVQDLRHLHKIILILNGNLLLPSRQ
jgi:hypothetical protein